MFIDFHHHHVTSLPKRQLVTDEGQLAVDDLVPPDVLSGEVHSPQEPPPISIRPPPINAAETPSPDTSMPVLTLATTLPAPSASAVPVVQGQAQSPLLGLDTNPDRPEIIAILSGMSIVAFFLVILLFVLPRFQSKKRRDNRLCYVSENDPHTMSGLSRFGYTQYLDPPSPWQKPKQGDLSPPEFEVEDPMDHRPQHRPPGLNLAGNMVHVPLAPPSPRSGGLPSNPRSGLPSSHAYGGASFRDKMLRPMSGVVTWRVQEPMEEGGYVFDMARYQPDANPYPQPPLRQSIRDSIVSTFSFGKKHTARASSGQITRGDMMQVNRGSRYI